LATTAKSVAVTNDAAPVFNWKQIFVFSAIAVLVAMTIMSFWYGISGDEVDMNNYGKAILDYYTSFGAKKNALAMPKELDRDGVLHLYGGFYDLLAALLNKISPFEEYATRHILNAWTGFIAIFFAAKLCIRFSGYRAATIVTWLMFLAPFFLGHAMNNPKDVPFAAAYIAGVYCFVRFYDKLPQVKWKDYIWPVVSLAIAIDVRVAGILLIPFMAVYHFLNSLFNSADKKPLAKVVLPLAIVSVLGYLGASIFWPYALQNPIANPLKALSELSNFKMSLAQLYEGERTMSSELPPSYLIKNFVITNAYVLLIGLLLFPIFFFLRKKDSNTAGIIFLAFIALFPLVYIIYKESNVYHAWRHVLFIFPAAAAIAALGFEFLLEAIKSKTGKMVAGGLIVLGMMEPAYFTVKTFPNTITYYNGIVGGVQEAYFNYETDYYYNSMKGACDWFEKNVVPKLSKTDTVVVATNASHIASIYLKKYPNIKCIYVRFYERSMTDWDYGIFHRALIPAPMIENKSWLVNKTLYAESVEDLPLCVVLQRPSHEDFKGFELLKQNKMEEGFQHLIAYNKIDKGNEIVNEILARFFTAMGQPEKAQQVAQGKGAE